jgi:CheY-like chemotaxis protein
MGKDNEMNKILIVEDEPVISEFCRRVLIGVGFEVDCAINGILAQDMIAKSQYDFCLIDMRTPKMTGMELYQWLQKNYPQLAIRVIFTTGDVMGGDMQSFLEQSGRPFLRKPFTTAELKAIIRVSLLDS